MNRPVLLFLFCFALLEPSAVLAQDKSEPLPAHAYQRFGTTRLRHGSRILCLAFSANGKMLAAGGGNDPVRLWDAETGAEQRRLREFWVNAVAFSPRDGSLATAGMFKTIRLWDPATGREIAALEGHQSAVKTLAFSADGSQLASGSQDGAILLWKMEGARNSSLLKGHLDEIVALAFSPDGTRLASASGDRTIRLWNTANQQMILQIDGGCGLAGLVFSQDGKLLVSAGDDRLIRFWDAGNGKPLDILKGHEDAIASLCIARDGKTIFSGGRDRTIRMWDFASKKPGRIVPCSLGDSDALALTGDGKLLAYAGMNNTIHMVEIDSTKELLAGLGACGPVTAVMPSRDGKLLVSAGTDHFIRLWDRADGKENRSWPAGNQGETILALAPDNKTLASGADGITLWHFPSGERAGELASPARDPIVSLAYAPDGKWLAVGHRGGSVRLWNVADKKIAHELRYPGVPYVVGFSADGKTLAASGTSKIVLWETAGGKELRQIVTRDGAPATQPQVACLAFSPEGGALAVGCYDGIVRLFDLDSGKLIRSFEGHRSAVLSLAFSSSGRTLATGSFDHSVRAWETFSGLPIAHFSRQPTTQQPGESGHIGPVQAVCFTPDDRGICSGSTDTSILVWDLTGICKNGVLPEIALAPETLPNAWKQLALEDAVQSQRTVWQLVAGGKASVPFLDGQLYYVDPKLIDKLFVELDHDSFQVRNKASQELAKYGMWIQGRLKDALKKPSSEEVARRVEQLFEKLNTPGALPLEQERLRVQRVMLVLEQVGSPAAIEVLRKLVRGGPERYLQIEAQMALERLGRKKAPGRIGRRRED